jgi:hypothetical protein
MSFFHPHVLPPTGSGSFNANLDATTSVQQQAKEQSDHQTLKDYRKRDNKAQKEQLHRKNTKKEKMT